MLNPNKVGIAVQCVECGLRKSPHGRSAPTAMANSLCDHECPGYNKEPFAGCLWPGESEEDFGHKVCDFATKMRVGK